MLSLSFSSNRLSLIENMINNFAYLIDSYGFIPNGNQTYFLSRSQSSFFACIIQLFSDIRKKYLSYLNKEYQFWIMGKEQLTETNITNRSTHTSILSLAGVYPLFFNIATKEQAEYVHQKLYKDFLKDNGLVTTLERIGEQWDYRNGWPQLQFIAYQALKNHRFNQLANERIYEETGQKNEKYNVVENKNGEGGNYSFEHGIG